jgi:hypothetical protein
MCLCVSQVSLEYPVIETSTEWQLFFIDIQTWEDLSGKTDLGNPGIMECIAMPHLPN